MCEELFLTHKITEHKDSYRSNLAMISQLNVVLNNIGILSQFNKDKNKNKPFKGERQKITITEKERQMINDLFSATSLDAQMKLKGELKSIIIAKEREALN